MIVWYVLFLIICLILSTEYYFFKTGVPTIASFPPARRKIIECLSKHYPAHSTTIPYTIIDLGSGNGQLANKIARFFPQARVIGIEISYVPWLISRLRQKLFGPENLEYQRADFWLCDCSNMDVVVIFLTENIIERVSQKLRKELKLGALVVANDTALRGDWTPIEVVDTGFLKMKIFVYLQTG